MSTLIQILAVIAVCSLALYNYLDNLNDLTRLRLLLPQHEQALNQQLIEHQLLRDQWARLTRVEALYELCEKPEFCHLRHYQTPQKLPE